MSLSKFISVKVFERNVSTPVKGFKPRKVYSLVKPSTGSTVKGVLKYNTHHNEYCIAGEDHTGNYCHAFLTTLERDGWCVVIGNNHVPLSLS